MNSLTVLKSDVVNGFVSLMILHLMCLMFLSVAVLLNTNVILSEILRRLPCISFQKKKKDIYSHLSKIEISDI